VIHKIFAEVDLSTLGTKKHRADEDPPAEHLSACLRCFCLRFLCFLGGTIVAIPVLNPPGYLRNTREFSDGVDLNRTFPGAKDGAPSSIFCFNIVKKIVSHVDYLVDMHTASFGRVNSYYVRADMSHNVARQMGERIPSPSPFSKQSTRYCFCLTGCHATCRTSAVAERRDSRPQQLPRGIPTRAGDAYWSAGHYARDRRSSGINLSSSALAHPVLV
jgi:hypothetical protein